MLEILRPMNCLVSGVAVIIGVIISSGMFSSVFSLPVLFAFFSCFLICGAGNVINDYYDVEIDRINAPNRPIPSGRMTREFAGLYARFLFLAGIVFAYYTNSYLFWIAFFESVILYIYGAILKRYGFAGNIVVAFSVGITFIYGGLAVVDFSHISRVFILFFCAFFATLSREIMKDIEDIEGDSALKSQTLPVILGLKKTSYLSALFLSVAVLLSFFPIKYGIVSVIPYTIIIIISDIVFIISIYKMIYLDITGNIAGIIQKKIKIGMYLAMLAFLLGI